MDTVQTVLWCACTAAQGAALIALLKRGIWQQYAGISAWLCLELFQSAALGTVTLMGYGIRTRPYFLLWEWTEPLIWAGWLWAAASCVDRLCRCYATWMRLRVFRALAVPVAVGIVFALLQSRVHSRLWSVECWALSAQCVACVCFLSITCSGSIIRDNALVILRYPRNVRIQTAALACYFGCVWIATAAIHLSGGWWIHYGSALLLAGELCAACSLLRMSRDGDIMPQQDSRPEDASRALWWWRLMD